MLFFSVTSNNYKNNVDACEWYTYVETQNAHVNDIE